MKIFDGIVRQQDIFELVYKTQLALITSLHENTMAHVEDARCEIIEEIRVRHLSPSLSTPRVIRGPHSP